MFNVDVLHRVCSRLISAFKVYKYTEHFARGNIPLLHGLECLFWFHHTADELVDGTRASLQIMDNGTEV